MFGDPCHRSAYSAVVSARLLTIALCCSAGGLLQMTMLGADLSWTVALPGLYGLVTGMDGARKIIETFSTAGSRAASC